MKSEIIILDCSITIAWILLDDKMTEKANDVLESLGENHAKVPSIWHMEVANVLCIAERQKKLTALEVSEFKEFLSALPINFDDSTSLRAMGSIYTLAKTEQLTIYDAAYLELAIRENLSLATFDKDLQKAAKRNGISVL